MSIPEPFRADVEKLPPLLRALLEAELAAGNAIDHVGHSFPAPPVGAYIKLVKPVTTRPRTSGDGLQFRERQSSLSSGEFTDERRFFFIVEPPSPPPPEPDMDAIRAGLEKAAATDDSKLSERAARSPGLFGALGSLLFCGTADTPLEKFKRSMVIDYEKWHDGIGYDLDAIAAASPEERGYIEMLLLQRGAADWRDVEALAALDTPRARAVLTDASQSKDHQVRAAVIRYRPELVSDQRRTESIVLALESADFYSGLTEALDDAVDFHPPEVMDALFRGALERQGSGPVHFAALLLFLHGKAAEPFDWALRPFFLKFNTADRDEREALFRELCSRIDVDPSGYLAKRRRPKNPKTRPPE